MYFQSVEFDLRTARGVKHGIQTTQSRSYRRCNFRRSARHSHQSGNELHAGRRAAALADLGCVDHLFADFHHLLVLARSHIELKAHVFLSSPNSVASFPTFRKHLQYIIAVYQFLEFQGILNKSTCSRSKNQISFHSPGFRVVIGPKLE